MSTEHEFRYAVGQREVKGYDTQELRDAFLADKLMQEGKIYWIYSHYERFMVGSAVPTNTPLKLETLDDQLKMHFFISRDGGESPRDTPRTPHPFFLLSQIRCLALCLNIL